MKRFGNRLSSVLRTRRTHNILASIVVPQLRNLSTVAVLLLLHVSSTGAQEPSVENFTRYRALAMEKLNGREGGRLNSNLLRIFGIPDDIRIVTDAEMGFENRRLTVTFSMNSSDLFLTDSRTTPPSTVVTIFHTDLTLALHAVASGVSVSDLRRIATDNDAESHVQEVLLRWDRELPKMLEWLQRK